MFIRWTSERAWFRNWVIFGIGVTLLMLVAPEPVQTEAGHADLTRVPVVEWSFTAGGAFYASPVVDGDIAVVGGCDSLLHAVDLHSGAERWRFRTGGEIRSAVCAGADALYLNGGDGSLYALEKRSGRQIWKFTTKGERKYDFADYFHSSPVLSGGVLYFGSGDGNFYAVEARSGRLVWSFATGNIIHTTPAISNGQIFFGSFDGHCYALNQANGELLWKFKTVGHRFFPSGEVQGSPAVYKDLVFFGARDYNVYALDQEKGYAHWNKSFPRGWALAMTVHDSLLYIGSSDERVHIAVDPASGAESWKVTMEFLVFGNDAFTDSLLYVGTTNGKLHAMSLRTGRTLWSFRTASYEKNRLKYFKEDDSYRDDIYSIITSNEQFLDVECELGGIFSTPVIAGGRLLLTSTNGTLYALRP
jgi:outer membrane protein assembly factor BamB